jgi:hypothetical protein
LEVYVLRPAGLLPTHQLGFPSSNWLQVMEKDKKKRKKGKKEEDCRVRPWD